MTNTKTTNVDPLVTVKDATGKVVLTGRKSQVLAWMSSRGYFGQIKKDAK